MNREFVKLISFLCVVILFSGFFLNSLTSRSYFVTLKSSSAPEVYLPGVLDLRGIKSPILGIESEVLPKEVVKFVNRERENLGFTNLRISPALEKAAKMRADVILKYQNASHQDPYENIQLDTVLPKVGYSYKYSSENIALAQGNSEGFVNGWMNSPSHRKNLLDPNLVETGVGVTYGKVGNYYVTIAVQLFAIPEKLEAFKGYNENDIKNVKDLLVGVNKEITRTNNLISVHGDTAYYLGWKTLLNRQNIILTTIYAYMQTGQAYKQEHYDLIAEYNSNWEKAPK